MQLGCQSKGPYTVALTETV